MKKQECPVCGEYKILLKDQKMCWDCYRMTDKEHISREIEYLNFLIKDTEDAISDYKKRIINLRQQRDNLRKELLKNQQLLWGCGGKE